MEGLQTIGEVSRRLNLSVSTLKNWEERGYIPRAKRIKRNRIRAWSESQIQEIIKFMREG